MKCVMIMGLDNKHCHIRKSDCQEYNVLTVQHSEIYRKNYHSNGRNLLLYLFIIGVIKLIVVIVH
jgi:hypothetical protein